MNENFATTTLQPVPTGKSKPCLPRKIYPKNLTHRNKRCRLQHYQFRTCAGFKLGVGTISRTQTPNPNYPNPNPNYPNPNYPITISGRNLRNPNLIRVIRVSTPGTRITRTPLKPNRLWSNPLTWPQQRNKKFSCYIYWLLVCLICAIIAICWSYFCISSLFFLLVV